ncbi:MAG: hypothetical protein J7M21_04060, partial [Planctomycetes bacterium]|nr:hypothetical protein [Planctomycetota bacterium]
MTRRTVRPAGGSPAPRGPAVAASAVVAALLLLAGCQKPVTPQARKLLADCQALYDRGDDANAVRLAGEFLEQYGRTALADDARYLRGLARLRQAMA